MGNQGGALANAGATDLRGRDTRPGDHHQLLIYRCGRQDLFIEFACQKLHFEPPEICVLQMADHLGIGNGDHGGRREPAVPGPWKKTSGNVVGTWEMRKLDTKTPPDRII